MYIIGGKITSLPENTFFSGILKVSILYSWIAMTTRATTDPFYFTHRSVILSMSLPPEITWKLSPNRLYTVLILLL